APTGSSTTARSCAARPSSGAVISAQSFKSASRRKDSPGRPSENQAGLGRREAAYPEDMGSTEDDGMRRFAAGRPRPYFRRGALLQVHAAGQARRAADVEAVVRIDDRAGHDPRVLLRGEEDVAARVVLSAREVLDRQELLVPRQQ